MAGRILRRYLIILAVSGLVLGLQLPSWGGGSSDSSNTACPGPTPLGQNNENFMNGVVCVTTNPSSGTVRGLYSGTPGPIPAPSAAPQPVAVHHAAPAKPVCTWTRMTPVEQALAIAFGTGPSGQLIKEMNNEGLPLIDPATGKPDSTPSPDRK